jgi:hypothetical protein
MKIMKNTLEKILHFGDKQRISILIGTTALIMVGSLVSNASAGSLRIDNLSSSFYGGGFTTAKHIEGATDGWEDLLDSIWPGTGPYSLGVYSAHPEFIYPRDKFKTDARGVNSLSSYNIELLNNGGFSGLAENHLRFLITDSSNFEWKNIFFNINEQNEDIKHLIQNGIYNPIFDTNEGIISLASLDGDTTIGVYNTGTLQFFNYADLNRDRKVNFADFAVFANQFEKDNLTDPNRFGSYVGSNVNDLGAYADINRSGIVDSNDIALFANEWLWDANDPNTWNR